MLISDDLPEALTGTTADQADPFQRQTDLVNVSHVPDVRASLQYATHEGSVQSQCTRWRGTDIDAVGSKFMWANLFAL